MQDQLVRFLSEEDGAVSVDFVVLTAVVVTLAMFIWPMVVSPVSNVAEAIGTQVDRYGDYIPPR